MGYWSNVGGSLQWQEGTAPTVTTSSSNLNSPLSPPTTSSSSPQIQTQPQPQILEGGAWVTGRNPKTGELEAVRRSDAIERGYQVVNAHTGEVLEDYSGASGAAQQLRSEIFSSAGGTENIKGGPSGVYISYKPATGELIGEYEKPAQNYVTAVANNKMLYLPVSPGVAEKLAADQPRIQTKELPKEMQFSIQPPEPIARGEKAIVVQTLSPEDLRGLGVEVVSDFDQKYAPAMSRMSDKENAVPNAMGYAAEDILPAPNRPPIPASKSNLPFDPFNIISSTGNFASNAYKSISEGNAAVGRAAKSAGVQSLTVLPDSERLYEKITSVESGFVGEPVRGGLGEVAFGVRQFGVGIANLLGVLPLKFALSPTRATKEVVGSFTGLPQSFAEYPIATSISLAPLLLGVSKVPKTSVIREASTKYKTEYASEFREASYGEATTKGKKGIEIATAPTATTTVISKTPPKIKSYDVLEVGNKVVVKDSGAGREVFFRITKNGNIQSTGKTIPPELIAKVGENVALGKARMKIGYEQEGGILQKPTFEELRMNARKVLEKGEGEVKMQQMAGSGVPKEFMFESGIKYIYPIKPKESFRVEINRGPPKKVENIQEPFAFLKEGGEPNKVLTISKSKTGAPNLALASLAEEAGVKIEPMKVPVNVKRVRTVEKKTIVSEDYEYNPVFVGAPAISQPSQTPAPRIQTIQEAPATRVLDLENVLSVSSLRQQRTLQIPEMARLSKAGERDRRMEGTFSGIGIGQLTRARQAQQQPQQQFQWQNQRQLQRQAMPQRASLLSGTSQRVLGRPYGPEARIVPVPRFGSSREQFNFAERKGKSSKRGYMEKINWLMPIKEVVWGRKK